MVCNYHVCFLIPIPSLTHFLLASAPAAAVNSPRAKSSTAFQPSGLTSLALKCPFPWLLWTLSPLLCFSLCSSLLLSLKYWCPLGYLYNIIFIIRQHLILSSPPMTPVTPHCKSWEVLGHWRDTTQLFAMDFKAFWKPARTYHDDLISSRSPLLDSILLPKQMPLASQMCLADTSAGHLHMLVLPLGFSHHSSAPHVSCLISTHASRLSYWVLSTKSLSWSPRLGWSSPIKI